MKQRVDVLNFLLIWVTLGLALAWPFQLFLFSYIVLGPLHYLTEINWLDKQNYFLRAKDRRAFIWIMVVIVAALGICTYLPEMDKWESYASDSSFGLSRLGPGHRSRGALELYADTAGFCTVGGVVVYG